MRSPTLWFVGRLAMVLGAGVLVSCAGPKAETAGDKPDGIAAPKATEPDDEYSAAAANLQAMFEQGRGAGNRQAPGVWPSAEAGGTPAPPGAPVEVTGPPPPAPGGMIDVAESPVGDAPAQAASPESRRNELIDELARLLETEPGRADGPFRRGVQLAMFEAMQAGVAAAALQRLEPELSPAEFAALEGLCEALHQVATGSEASGTPAGLAGVLEEAAGKLAATRTVSIQTVALCQRVDGFGRYVPFAENSFAAGRSQDVIVYVEVDNFAQRPWSAERDSAAAPTGSEQPVGGTTQWVTELGQEVTLYSADGYQALYRPEQVVRDVARRARRDYYLVQRLTLPPTLAIGRYSLKVTVRDKTSKGESQLNVPISIVDALSAAPSR